tara:strand:- start:481 stop:987 length:507 start_codon:yes stop_codon:yes gene_type:complete
MDLGRVYCQANKVDCLACPLSKDCAVAKENPLIYPSKLKKVKKRESNDLELLRVLVKKDNLFLAYKKSENEWLSGQKEFPTFILKTSDKSLSQYPYWDGQVNLNLKSLKKFKTGITKYKITNYVLEISEEKWKKSFSCGKRRFFFVNPDSKDENLSTSSTKAVLALNK